MRKENMMATYVMSDLHGNYDGYISILEQINFSDEDVMYVNGDVIDRGAEGIKILQHMMMQPNIYPICGNHEYAALQVLPILPMLTEELTEEITAEVDEGMLRNLMEYLNIGGLVTLDAFRELSDEEKEDIIEYLEEFMMYAEIEVNGKQFVIVHAGLSNFNSERALDTYEPYELLFESPDYKEVYYPDKYLVTGHLPTTCIENAKPDKIYMANNHIALDCGSGFGGPVGCVRLDDLKTFYAKID